MNSDSNQKDQSPSQDCLTDALLAEHARLGSKPDEELVANILLNTVNAPIENSHFVPAARKSFTMNDWVKVAALVAVIASIGAVVLNYLGSGESVVKANPRQEATFHFVVNGGDVVDGDGEKVGIDRGVLMSARPGTNKFEPVFVDVADGVSAFEMAEASLEAPATEFGRSIDALPAVSSVRATFNLASNDKTSEGAKVIYSGDVVLSHPDFVLTADSLVMDHSAGGVPLLKASNAVVTHRKGAYESRADAMLFDPSTSEVFAKGIQKLVRRGQKQSIADKATVVVFAKDDFAIESVLSSPF